MWTRRGSRASTEKELLKCYVQLHMKCGTSNNLCNTNTCSCCIYTQNKKWRKKKWLDSEIFNYKSYFWRQTISISKCDIDKELKMNCQLYWQTPTNGYLLFSLTCFLSCFVNWKQPTIYALFTPFRIQRQNFSLLKGSYQLCCNSTAASFRSDKQMAQGFIIYRTGL